MTHNLHRKPGKSLKRRLKRMAAAAAVAGAAFLTSAFMPGLPAVVHASAAPAAAALPDAAGQQTVKSPKGIYNFQSDSKIPLKKQMRMQAKAQAKAAAEQTRQRDKAAAAPQVNSHRQVKQDAAKAVSHTQAVQAQTTAAAAPAEKNSATAPDNFAAVFDVKATAYAPGEHDNGQWGDKTHLGTTVRPGVIAVDPDVIPLGSRVYVEYPDGTGHYATAEDTGGAIKGNRIDVAVSSVGKAYDFGIKNAKVYVVNKA